MRGKVETEQNLKIVVPGERERGGGMGRRALKR